MRTRTRSITRPEPCVCVCVCASQPLCCNKHKHQPPATPPPLPHARLGRIANPTLQHHCVCKFGVRTVSNVPQVRLYLDLSTKLVLHPGLEQLLLLQDLDGHDVARPLLSREVHRPELALPEGAPDLEVAHGPVLPLPRRRSHASRAGAAVGAAVPVGAAAASPSSPSPFFPRLLKLDALRAFARRGVVVVVLHALRAPLGRRTTAVAGVVALPCVLGWRGLHARVRTADSDEKSGRLSVCRNQSHTTIVRQYLSVIMHRIVEMYVDYLFNDLRLLQFYAPKWEQGSALCQLYLHLHASPSHAEGTWYCNCMYVCMYAVGRRSRFDGLCSPSCTTSRAAERVWLKLKKTRRDKSTR